MTSRLQVQILIFAKSPRPGWAKTRLAASLGQDKAAAACYRLLDRLVDNLHGIPGVILRHTPDDAGAEMRGWLRSGWELEPQGPGDLGDRLERAFASCFARGSRKVVIVGSDCPYVEQSDIEAAADALNRADVVLGPARDGGYWLIGLRACDPGLFRGIPWSTELVLSETCRRALRAGLEVELLRDLEDVDTLEAWERFEAHTKQPREDTGV